MANHLLKRKQHSLFTPYDVAMSKKDTKWRDLRETAKKIANQCRFVVDLFLPHDGGHVFAVRSYCLI